MSIDRGAAAPPAPFEGAEVKVRLTTPAAFRSFERSGLPFAFRSINIALRRSEQTVFGDEIETRFQFQPQD